MESDERCLQGWEGPVRARRIAALEASPQQRLNAAYALQQLALRSGALARLRERELQEAHRLFQREGSPGVQAERE